MGKHIAFIVIDDFADWEPAHLSAAVRTYFDGSTSFHTPGGKPVTSMGGMTIAPGNAVEDLRPDAYDALVVVGSAAWIGADAPDVSAALQAADEAGKVVGAICAGTLAAGRAGLLDSRRHTSNALDFVQENASGYRAWDLYVDTPAAVRDGTLVTAAGSAPVTFTVEVLSALHPEHAEGLERFRAMCAAELAGSFLRVA
ncbi:DJ-1/PfpI family protein [Phenylobacterium sp.]|uniref:DJ-1/PfpI family protein n=1 Tax=Phenylobacterium sp. TaxID=1871053 RepID=UPI00289F5E38|nr:DJ-1/PfpI family protein [Phenylobacterium sp.]